MTSDRELELRIRREELNLMNKVLTEKLLTIKLELEKLKRTKLTTKKLINELIELINQTGHQCMLCKTAASCEQCPVYNLINGHRKACYSIAPYGDLIDKLDPWLDALEKWETFDEAPVTGIHEIINDFQKRLNETITWFKSLIEKQHELIKEVENDKLW